MFNIQAFFTEMQNKMQWVMHTTTTKGVIFIHILKYSPETVEQCIFSMCIDRCILLQGFELSKTKEKNAKQILRAKKHNIDQWQTTVVSHVFFI